jgi:hypothetical protein
MYKQRCDITAKSSKIVALTNLWIYACVLLIDKSPILRDNVWVLCSLITFALAFTYNKLPLISSRSTEVLSVVMHIIGILGLWISSSSTTASLILVSVAELVGMLAIYDMINLTGEQSTRETRRSIMLLGYFLLVLTQGLMVRGDIAFNSAVISIIYALASLAWIIVGFRFNLVNVRKFGLTISMASVVKLLAIDTLGLETGARIISYVALGLLLMLISWIYQQLDKRL